MHVVIMTTPKVPTVGITRDKVGWYNLNQSFLAPIRVCKSKGCLQTSVVEWHEIRDGQRRQSPVPPQTILTDSLGLAAPGNVTGDASSSA